MRLQTKHIKYSMVVIDWCFI